MDIRILPSNVANLIAAGEVVQRPSSVVKELMENAVDAGADQITVVISDSGRTLIQVIDNGCGMSPDQAVLCFERHATSKLATAQDLNKILTFGFRGEALASIAAVAEVTLKTCRQEDQTGCQVDFADSRHIDTKEVATPKGSNFSVRNLFYNVPARRKFLKSDNVEFKHIVSEFIRVALTCPEIGFTLTHNGKNIFVLRPAKSLKFRIQDVLGAGVANDIVDVSADTSVVKVSGYIGRPDAAKKGLGNQFFFVNGRYFRSSYLHKAVMKAYEHLIPEGVTPSYFIYLELSPESVDVNIHPTKTEIKFEDDSVIFQIIYASIKEALGKNSFVESIDFDREGAPDIPAFGRNFDEFHPVSSPHSSVDETYNPFENDGFPSETDHNWGAPKTQYHSGGQMDFMHRTEDYGKLFEDKLKPARSVLVLHGNHIVTTGQNGLVVINAQRAKERIFFDRFFEALSKNNHLTQTALFPVTVQVGVENMYLFAEHAQMLSELGFDIAPFGTDTIVVNGVPEGYSAEEGKVLSMIGDLILVLSEECNVLPEMMIVDMASRFARLGSFNSEKIKNPEEAQSLIEQLYSCENPEYTNSGRRIVSIITLDELDKRF